MAVHDIVVEDYFYLFYYTQGNVNVSGLVFDDLVNTTLDLGFDVSTLNIEMLSDAISFSESFDNVHTPYSSISEKLSPIDALGSPVRCFYFSANLVHSLRLTPIHVCSFHLDILHGTDIYYFDVSSGIHFLPFTAVANYFVESIYESLDVVMEENAPVRDAYVRYYMSGSSIANTRDFVEQEYLFNSFVSEEILPFVTVSFGWLHTATEYLRVMSYAMPYLSSVCDEFLFSNDSPYCIGSSSESVSDTIFVVDSNEFEKYYLLLVDETISSSVSIDAVFLLLHKIIDEIGIKDIPEYGSVMYFELLDTIRTYVNDKVSYAFNEVTGDGIAFGDDGISMCIYRDVANSTQSFADQSSLVFLASMIVNSNISVVDSGD